MRIGCILLIQGRFRCIGNWNIYIHWFWMLWSSFLKRGVDPRIKVEVWPRRQGIRDRSLDLGVRKKLLCDEAKGAKIFSAAVAATIDSQQIGKDGEEKLKMHTHSYCCLDYVQLKPVSVVIDFTDPSMVYDNVKQHNEDSVSFDCNGAFGHEDPNSQASLEDLCRSHLVKTSFLGYFLHSFYVHYTICHYVLLWKPLIRVST
ncbi:uncharacterized protein LOC131248683 isoform X2 [Magnolia sinica]|uniref:uncharacterized protein LOC131248683 isoform X2 n=1 Tax=Magnolia sinica TaxID=86752 RepID=UPI00265B1D93|nr:uncharacterized protein LOC131248683 isoform X2 [Magnolia sinica]